MHWRRKWQPTPVFLPGESQGQGSLVGCCLWGPTESDTTERLSSSSSTLMSVTCLQSNQSVLLKPKTDLVTPMQKVLQRLPNLYNGHLDLTLLLPLHHLDPISCYSAFSLCSSCLAPFLAFSTHLACSHLGGFIFLPSDKRNLLPIPPSLNPPK